MLRNAISPLKGEDNSPSTSACPPPTCVVCLGLGSLNDSTKAQDQYVLFKELLIELGELVSLYFQLLALLSLIRREELDQYEATTSTIL